MNIIDNKNHCSGCGACSLVCPKKSIKIAENEYGNLVAFVDDNCINCGLCKKVCSKFEINNTRNINEGTLYAVEAKDDELALSCTSSGIATKIAEYAINNGYYVIGVVYNFEKNIAEEIITNNIDDLGKIKKSKYLQAYTLHAFQKLIELAKENVNNKFVVFGMPCQINGLKSAVEMLKINNEIVYIDFFCHGVPSYLTWKKYLQEKHIDKLNSVCFRDKNEGWHEYIMNLNNKTSYAIKDNFYKAFFDNILLNSVCFDCKARQGETKADIRLGDFWGKKYKLNKKGVSACLILTEEGKGVLKNIDKDFDIKEIQNKKDCFNSQSLNEYGNIELHDKAMQILKTDLPLSKVIGKYRRKLGAKFIIKQTAKRAVYCMPIKVRDKIKEKI